jgi:chromosome segregation ATPase
MLTVALGILAAIAVTAAAFLFLRLQKQIAAHRQLDDSHQQLAREHEEFKNRYRAVLDVEAEKARVLQTLESERATIQADIAGALDEKRRVLEDLETEKQKARAQVEAEAQARRAELEAERTRLEGVIAQIKVNQQELLDDLRDKRRQGESDMAAFQVSIDRLRAEFNALDEEANLQSFGFYKPRYAFADSISYQRKLDEIRDRQKQMVKNKSAAVCPVEWTVNGSRAEGESRLTRR